MLLRFLLSALLPLAASALVAEKEPEFQTTSPLALAFVGAQHWVESGIYSDTGLSAGYDGFYCLCGCSETAQGVFCSGGGLHPDLTAVGTFLVVYAQTSDGAWEGSLSAFNSTTPFTDKFVQKAPGSPANYTGVSSGSSPRHFVWRGTMSGPSCALKDKCSSHCAVPLASKEPQQLWNWGEDAKAASRDMAGNTTARGLPASKRQPTSPVPPYASYADWVAKCDANADEQT